VPHHWPATSSIASYTGPLVTTEWRTTSHVTTGPNAGKVYAYYVLARLAHTWGDFSSAFEGGVWDYKLLYPNGTQSGFFWYGAGRLGNDISTRSRLKVDGRNAYGPTTAANAFTGAKEIPGLPRLTFSMTRDEQAGTLTIYETSPIVVCPHNTFPPTATSCPRFKPAGVRLERTIFITDGGYQVRVSDVWRSTNHKAHVVLPDYQQEMWGYDQAAGGYTPVEVGVKLPWISNVYVTSPDDHVYPGPDSGPASIFIRGNNLVADGDKDFPRGAISFDVVPDRVHRTDHRTFDTRPAGLEVPANGKRLLRMFYVLGTNQSVVNAKAAANRQRLG
jgi:hypothetical protein